MKAWRVDRLGEPSEVLRFGDVPDPEPGPGEVVVRVLAAACNFPDILMCRGTYQERPPLPFTPGQEVAGEVVAVGEGVDHVAGDRVIGQPVLGQGGFAEFSVLDAARAVSWPPGMSAHQAAAMFVTYQTGYCGLHHRGRLERGETLVVLAAAGGIGSAAVQLGVAAGATVIGAAGGAEKCATVRDLGADHVVDYRTEDVTARVLELTGGRGADVVYDPVGGDLFGATRHAVASEGRILVIGFAAGEIGDAPTNHLLVKNYSVVGVHWGLYRRHRPEMLQEWHRALLRHWGEGSITPLVGRIAPLADVPAALEGLGSRGTLGKVVISP